MEKNYTCRVCGAETEPYFNFGKMPLANNLNQTKQEALEAERYVLELCRCDTCTLSQLSVTVPPEKLYSHYVYRSSMSETYKKHCFALAEKLRDEYGAGKDSLCMDIAGNDGALLYEFKKVLGGPSICVDPAHNLLQHAQDKGLAIFKAFWGKKAVGTLLDAERRAGRFIDGADVITATNVFAHVDDVHDFLEGVKLYLKPGGLFIVEMPHLLDFLIRCEFDTAYFEHLSYFSLTAFMAALSVHDMEVFDVEKLAIHGGTIRIWCAHKGVKKRKVVVDEVLKTENVLRYSENYKVFKNTVYRKLEAVNEYLRICRTAGKKVVGFGASAKGNILLNCIDEDLLPEYIIDETPEKIGKFSPGIGLEIKPFDFILDDRPDVVIILAWNFFTEMEKKLRARGYTGEVLCPL